MPSTTTSPPLDWFPVDAAKTLSHQDLLGLKLPELGAFLILRLFCWKDGSVPVSPARLAGLCRCSEKQMVRLLERLGDLLSPHPERPDRLIMPLVEKDRANPGRVYAEVPGPAAVLPAIAKVETSAETTAAETGTTVETADRIASAEARVEEVESTSPAATKDRPTSREPSNTAAQVATVPTPPAMRRAVPNAAFPEASRETETASETQLPDERAGGSSAAKPSPSPQGPGAGSPAPTSPQAQTTNGLPAANVLEDEIELVFSAHEFGLRTLAEVTGEPYVAYSRSPAPRRRAIVKAIQAVGFLFTQRAARNQCLSADHRGENDLGKKFLEVEYVMEDPEYFAGIYEGSNEGLAEALRASLKASALEMAEEEDSTIHDGAASGQEPKTVSQVANTEASHVAKKERETPKKPSFFMEQESVFNAHEFGLCALGEVRGESDKYKPERHYRMLASRRRAVAAAIKEVGVDVARHAARNLPLSVHLQVDRNGFHPLDIENAFRSPQELSQLFCGPDDELSKALRAASADQRQHQERLLKSTAPAPWQQPAKPTKPAKSEPKTQTLF